MELNKKIIIGFLALIITSTIVYITFMDQVKIQVDADSTSFYITQGSRWLLSGKESNKIINGTTTLGRDTKNIRIVTQQINNTVFIKRYTPYLRGPLVVDIYYFDGNVSDVKLFPVSHIIEIYNASGLKYEYTASNIQSDLGEQFNLSSPVYFGRNMSIEWDGLETENYLVGSNFKILYDIKNNESIFSIRLFDPEVLPKYVCAKYKYNNETYYDFNNVLHTERVCAEYKCIAKENNSIMVCENCTTITNTSFVITSKIKTEAYCEKAKSMQLIMNNTLKTINFKKYGCVNKDDILLCLSSTDGYNAKTLNIRKIKGCDSGETCTIYNITNGNVIYVQGRRIDLI